MTVREHEQDAADERREYCPVCGNRFADVQDENVCPVCDRVSTRDALIGEWDDYEWVV